MTDHELGVFGELMAQKQLKEDGYHIKQTNFRYLKYEIDIVAEKGEELIIVEVKTRQTAVIGEPNHSMCQFLHAIERYSIKCSFRYHVDCSQQLPHKD